MRSNPVIVLLDDDLPTIRGLRWSLEDHPLVKGNNIEIAEFTDDESAAQFVIDNASRIIGYVQDINRPISGSIGPAGIHFYRRVIDRFTPLAKTVFYSGALPSIGVHEGYELPRVSVDKIRTIEKPFISSGIIDYVRWFLSPLENISSSGQKGKQDTVHIIELVSPPWEEVCKYLSQKPEYLHELNPRKFEMLVAEIFKSHGWDVDLTAQTRDGGYDIIAVKRVIPTKMRVLVEAKRWSPNRTVGVQVVRSLYGLRAVHSFSQVVLATSTYVSSVAKKEFQRVIPWELDFIERDAILDWCKTYSDIKLSGHLEKELNRKEDA
jgi:restriction endonuclease